MGMDPMGHMTALRAMARGRPCMVRLPGVCNFDEATTVLAHYRLAGTAGTGLKPPDLLGAWACSACHDVVDGRVSVNWQLMTKDDVRRYHAEGVMRTIYALLKLGLLRGVIGDPGELM